MAETRLAFTASEAFAIVPDTVAEAFREEGRKQALEAIRADLERQNSAMREAGRREVLREIAKREPWLGFGQRACFFCGVRVKQEHDSQCLWCRASQVPQ